MATGQLWPPLSPEVRGLWREKSGCENRGFVFAVPGKGVWPLSLFIGTGWVPLFPSVSGHCPPTATCQALSPSHSGRRLARLSGPQG